LFAEDSNIIRHSVYKRRPERQRVWLGRKTRQQVMLASLNVYFSKGILAGVCHIELVFVERKAERVRVANICQEVRSRLLRKAFEIRQHINPDLLAARIFRLEGSSFIQGVEI